MLWAYFSFSQFLIIWSGNLPEEIPWYMQRIAARLGRRVAWLIVLFHFALPFVLLLSRDLKRNAAAARRAWPCLMLVMRLVDLFWQVEPGFGTWRPRRSPASLLDVPGGPGSPSAASGSGSSSASSRSGRSCRSTIPISRRRSANGH